MRVAAADPEGGQLGPALHAEVAEDDLGVLVHCERAEAQPPGDLLVSVSLQQAAEDLSGPRRQGCGGGLVEPGQRPADQRGQQGLGLLDQLPVARAEIVRHGLLATERDAVEFGRPARYRQEADESVVDPEGVLNSLAVRRANPLPVGDQILAGTARPLEVQGFLEIGPYWGGETDVNTRFGNR